MRRPLNFLALLAFPAVALAGGGHLWKTDSVRDFAAGEGIGIRFEAEGGIAPGPALSELGRVEETLLLSAVRTPSGETFVGTGFSGHAYRIPAAAGKPVQIPTAEGTGVFALASVDGAVYAGTSPGGKVFRIDGKTAELAAETGLGSIWAMAAEPSGTLLVAGGSPGRLLRLKKGGGKLAWETLIESKEPNLRSVAVAADGTIWCGSDGHGLVYRIARGGRPEVLVDAARAEVVALLPRADGSLLFASTSGEAVTSRPAPASPSAGPASPATPQGSVSVETSLSAVPPPASSGRSGFDVQILRADGVVEMAASREDEIAYALAPGEGGRVLVATGPKGRIYEVDVHELSIVRDIPQKTAVALLPAGAGVFVVAGAEGGVIHRLGAGREPKGEFRSKVHAEDRRSLWGAYRVLASPGSAAKLAFRSGNSATPDESWSAYVDAPLPEGQVPSPAGRYLQWRITFEGDGFVRSVAVNAVPGNLRPVIESVSVLEPGVVFFRGSFGSGTPVIEAANPEERGMFTTVGEARERAELGKRIFRRGYRTLTWKASDQNDDPLLVDVRIRRVDEAGRPLGEWIGTVEGLTESLWSFDSSALPDGYWQFSVKASDRKANPPGEAREDEKLSLPVAVDATSPEVKVSANRDGDRLRVTVGAADALTPILRAELSVDGGEWVVLRSADGVTDERAEEFSAPAERPDGKMPSTVVVRVLDAAYNITTRAAWPAEGRK